MDLATVLGDHVETVLGLIPVFGTSCIKATAGRQQDPIVMCVQTRKLWFYPVSNTSEDRDLSLAGE